MKRKIIEIYVNENEEKGTSSYIFENLEDTKEANYMMKMLTEIFLIIAKNGEED